LQFGLTDLWFVRSVEYEFEIIIMALGLSAVLACAPLGLK